MNSLRGIESLGWGFFLVVFALLAGPFGWMTWAVTSVDAPAIERAGLGVVFAALLAAVIAWFVNDLLYRRNLRLHEAERKAERRTTKKKKKKHA